MNCFKNIHKIINLIHHKIVFILGCLIYEHYNYNLKYQKTFINNKLFFYLSFYKIVMLLKKKISYKY